MGKKTRNRQQSTMDLDMDTNENSDDIVNTLIANDLSSNHAQLSPHSQPNADKSDPSAMTMPAMHPQNASNILAQPQDSPNFTPLSTLKCPHAAKAVKLSKARKALNAFVKDFTFGKIVCAKCSRRTSRRSSSKRDESTSTTPPGDKQQSQSVHPPIIQADAKIHNDSLSSQHQSHPSGPAENVDEWESLWVCLTCGVIHCGRNDARHAIAHYDKTQHDCVARFGTWDVWFVATFFFFLCVPSQSEIPTARLSVHDREVRARRGLISHFITLQLPDV